MRSLVFLKSRCISLEERHVPTPGYGAAVIQVTLTTICGTDLHILKGEYAVKQGLILGHEAVGIIHEVGQGITDYKAGDGVLVGAITPCGQCGARIPP
jgi:alcohol dehydrogenase